MKRLAVILALAGCAAPALTDATGAQAGVLFPDPATMGSAPALRIGGTSDLETAIRVMAQFCGRPYAEVRDNGASGDPVWTDPATGEVVFWLEC